MKLEENKRYRLESGEETAPLVFENELYYDSISGLSFHENGTCASAFNRDIISVITDEVKILQEVADVPFMSKEEQDEIGVAEQSIEMIMEKYPVAEVPISKFSEMQLKIMPGISENHEVAFEEKVKKIINLPLSNEYPEINCIYKHYKGGHYRVLTLADHTETGELLVITQSVEFGTVRARPLTVWHSPIVPAQGDIKRFTLTQ